MAVVFHAVFTLYTAAMGLAQQGYTSTQGSSQEQQHFSTGPRQDPWTSSGVPLPAGIFASSELSSHPAVQGDALKMSRQLRQHDIGAAKRKSNESQEQQLQGSFTIPPHASSSGGLPMLFGANTHPGGEGLRLAPYIVLGVASSPQNTGHREWIRATYFTLPNVQRSVHAIFLIGVLTSQGTAHPTPRRTALRLEHVAHNDMLFLNARETNPPGACQTRVDAIRCDNS